MTAPAATDDFDQPRAGGNWFKPADHNGNLILITKVHEVRPAYDTLKQENVDRVEFDYVDLDDRTNLDPATGQPALVAYAYDNHAGIVSKIKPAISTGRGVLGRIGQAPSSKGNHAWILGPFDESGADAQRARDWLKMHNTPGQPAARPAPQAQAPAPRPMPAPAPAPQPQAPAPAPAPQAQAPAPALAPATPATAPAAAPGSDPAHQINGVQVDPQQWEQLKALGIVQ